MKKMLSLIKKHYIACICAISVVLLIFVFPALERRGTFGLDESQPYVTIECPEAVGTDGKIACNIMVNPQSKTILAINANYVIPENIEYVSFVVNENAFELYSVDEDNNESENGFAVVNLDGVTSETLIGTLTLRLGENATNSEYTIGLENIELCDDTLLEDESYEMFTSSDVSDTFRTLSNVATLESIVVSDAEPFTFASGTFEYDVYVSADVATVNVTLTKTDSNASLSGTALASNLPLHYGTNNYTIIVTAEDGVTSNTYTLHIHRAYSFSTSVYTYDETGNYIYTRADTGNVILNNIDRLSEGLHYNINNDNLEILYAEEVLKSIKIVNFNSNYTVQGNGIYIPSGLNRDNLLNNLTSETLTFKIFNGSSEITDGDTVLEEGYTLKVYYNNNEIDSFTISTDYVTFTDLIIDSNNNIIKRIPLGTTFATLSDSIETNGTVTFTNNEGNTAELSDNVCTGDTVTITTGSNTFTYTLSVLGDVVGTGTLEMNDIGTIYRYFRDRLQLEEYEIAAGDIYEDGSIAMNDVGHLFRFFRGRVDSLEGDE